MDERKDFGGSQPNDLSSLYTQNGMQSPQSAADFGQPQHGNPSSLYAQNGMQSPQSAAEFAQPQGSAAEGNSYDSNAYESLRAQYEAGQAQYEAQQQIPYAMPQKKKSGAKRAVFALCGVGGACLLFVGGALLGRQLSGGAPQAVTASSQKLPTLSIAENPSASDTAAAKPGSVLSGKQIYAKLSPSTVSISAQTRAGTNTGSGVIMSKDGYVITNNHVIEGASKITVSLTDGRDLTASLVGRDATSDLAVLKLPEGEYEAAEFGDSDKVQPGEAAYAIGSPGGPELANTITSGDISAVNRDITIDNRKMNMIQTSASINPGNSGGALINEYGQVIGITTAKLGIGSYEGLGFAIPMNTVKQIVDDLIQNGSVAHPSLGIMGQNMAQGVYVHSLIDGSKAGEGGLQPGDIIVKVEGESVNTVDQISAAVAKKKVGDKLSLEVYRMSDGQVVQLSVLLVDSSTLNSSDSTNTQQEQQNPYENSPSRDEFEQFFSDFFR